MEREREREREREVVASFFFLHLCTLGMHCCIVPQDLWTHLVFPSQVTLAVFLDPCGTLIFRSALSGSTKLLDARECGQSGVNIIPGYEGWTMLVGLMDGTGGEHKTRQDHAKTTQDRMRPSGAARKM